jgi:hypothetical protein
MEFVWPQVEGHSQFEVAYWVAQTALFLVAVIGLLFTYFQLRSLKRQAKATFLFELDKMWESSEFATARSRSEALRKDARTFVEQKHDGLDAAGKEIKIGEFIATEMARLRNEKTEDYVFLMKLCGFFETAGMLVHRRYAAFRDIDGLYRISILELYSEMQTHIRMRAETMPRDRGDEYLVHFRRLARRCRRRGAWRALLRR